MKREYIQKLIKYIIQEVKKEIKEDIRKTILKELKYINEIKNIDSKKINTVKKNKKKSKGLLEQFDFKKLDHSQKSKSNKEKETKIIPKKNIPTIKVGRVEIPVTPFNEEERAGAGLIDDGSGQLTVESSMISNNLSNNNNIKTPLNTVEKMMNNLTKPGKYKKIMELIQ